LQIVFFCSSGLEATEAAIKFVRRYFYSKGQEKRNRIITIEGGFHGRSIAAIKSYADGGVAIFRICSAGQAEK
jgi:acetylornithine/succinyldiaminopimelate/putrescine aminotransferase